MKDKPELTTLGHLLKIGFESVGLEHFEIDIAEHFHASLDQRYSVRLRQDVIIPRDPNRSVDSTFKEIFDPIFERIMASPVIQGELEEIETLNKQLTEMITKLEKENEALMPFKHHFDVEKKLRTKESEK